MTYNELKRMLRPISILDRVMSLLFNTPLLQNDYCPIYSDWLDKTLDNIDYDTVKVTPFYYEFKTKEGEYVKLWLGNYPFSYGNYEVCNHKPCRKYKYPQLEGDLKIKEVTTTL